MALYYPTESQTDRFNYHEFAGFARAHGTSAAAFFGPGGEELFHHNAIIPREPRSSAPFCGAGEGGGSIGSPLDDEGEFFLILAAITCAIDHDFEFTFD